MADLQLIVGDHPKYGDGDVLVARSEMHALAVAVDRACGWREAGSNSDGYRPRGGLKEKFHELVDQIRIERTAPGELTVTNQWTGEQRVLSLGNHEVLQRLRRLLRRRDGTPFERHGVFGQKGREVWFAGKQRPWRSALARMDALWDEIEAHTAYRRATFRRFQFGTEDHKQFLIVTCEPLTREQAATLVSPILDANGEEIASRKYWINWRPLVQAMGVAVEDVLNPEISLDLRDRQPRPVQRTDIQTRAVLSPL